jgi:hypothetical protein
MLRANLWLIFKRCWRQRFKSFSAVANSDKKIIFKTKQKPLLNKEKLKVL